MAAILAFAANSLFARAALAEGVSGPGAYAAIRLGAGALVLLPFIRGASLARDGWAGVFLALYAVAFSFAYVDLGTASGALILFATVQAVMVVVGLARGGRASLGGVAGILVALGGVAWLLAPGAGAVDAQGAALMMLAGVGWGLYSLVCHKGAGEAAAATAGAFAVAAVLALPLLLLGEEVTGRGALLALLSGGLTSGLGYVAWRMAAPHFSLTGVAAVQLATPVAAGLVAWPLLGETPGARLALAAVVILGGVALAMRAPREKDGLAEPAGTR
ncbi:DMT family transporter [Sphingomicrobium aestuariivivum]|uniref:DMT family transporter n=1 Tax=Sphingomicrobium aestuariivivum TaxID=1582356 RepID=UPI001FD6A077|nr:DMT family transporter [Sphingomicrobium aestuariivivum]MCJ8190688.1 DMT family transporter [Sphingomicrobium aestuariivivum]